MSGAPPSIGFKLEESIFRSDSILISGTVKDDIGLDRIEFVVNGEVYRNAAGDTVQIRPVSAEQVRELPFSVTLPLRVGENQIAIVAYDRDPVPKQSSHLETVYRRPPFYRQPLFWWSAALFLGLVVIAVGINEVLKRRVALVEKYNPYIAGAPIRNERMFFGREELLRRILNTIHSNSLMIYGPRRIGKTSLLHQVKKRLEKEQDERYFYLPVYIDLEGTPEDKLFATMMMDIVEECQRHLGDGLALRIFEASEEYTARDFSADVKRILSHLREHFGKQVKLVLLMDEVDELNSYSERINQRLRSVFMKTFAEDLVAVMSGSFIRKHWESEGSPWYNFFEEIKVGPISTEEALKLIREPVKGIFKYEERAVKKILEYSENVPYRIQKFCVNVVARAIEQRRRRITARDVEAVKARVLEGEEN
ncbi:MAG: AAA family ATPase [Calditrichaeota bacterium]|nr:MAG: AAA family ATPase [Calditrichota bacterium]